MADPATIEQTIERYQAAFSAGDRAGWLGLFADDATLEDPVGTPVRQGREAIGEFFDQMQSMVDRIEMEGCVTQVCGHEAAFHVTIRAITDQTTLRMDAIDVMTFDDDARITSMRAFFDPTKARVDEPGQ
jgi:steroid Delta-isomerase